MKETAQFVADATNCVPGLSTVFQQAVISARIVSMYAEASRGCRVLPIAWYRILTFLRYVLRSLTGVAHIRTQSTQNNSRFNLLSWNTYNSDKLYHGHDTKMFVQSICSKFSNYSRNRDPQKIKTRWFDTSYYLRGQLVH